MDIKEFTNLFAEEFDETPKELFSPETEFKNLEEWNSLTALSIISMVDDNLDKTITGADLRNHNTIADLFSFIESI